MSKKDDVYRTEVAKKLMKLREARGLSKKDVAKGTGISYDSYRYYETKVVPPSPNLIKLAEFFDVPLDYFTDREEDTPKDDYVPTDSGGGSLKLRNYDSYKAIEEEIGKLTEKEALFISIIRSASEEDQKKIARYLKRIRDKK